MVPAEASVPASNSNELVTGICGEMDGNGDGNGETIGVGLADADGKGVAEASGEGVGNTDGNGVGEIDGSGDGKGSPTRSVSGAKGLFGELFRQRRRADADAATRTERKHALWCSWGSYADLLHFG
jgi:hypothetical protein